MAGNDFIAGIGSTNVDLLYSGLERLPCEGEELYSKDFHCLLGGGVPATLINLGRLGIPVKIATELGCDMFSDFARRKFAENNVEPLNLYEGTDIPLNVSCAMITPQDRTFVSYGHGKVTATDENMEKLYNMCKGAKLVLMHVGEFIPVYEKLKAEGTILVFDCGWEENLNLENYGKYLEIADYYTPNRKEALLITGKDSIDEAARVLSGYFKRVIVKLDKDGCLGMEDGRKFTVSPVPGIKCVDSTGAGDAFLSGFCYGLYHGKSLEECIKFGNITGARCVEKVGCLTGHSTEEELMTLSKTLDVKYI